MRRVSLSIGGLLWFAVGCGPATEPLDVFVAAVDFASAPELDNRLDYEISGDDFEAPHTRVTDRVYVVETEAPEVLVARERRLVPTFDEPAPYIQGTPMSLRVNFAAAGGRALLGARVAVRGELRSTTDPRWGPRTLLEASAQVDPSKPLELSTSALPERVDVFELVLEWTLEGADCAPACAATESFTTRHLIPTTWRRPRAEVPRYRRAMLWSSTFAAGAWRAEGDLETVELELARRVLAGYATLARDFGKSYGAFPRPDYDGEVDGLDVWLDFPRSACGEQKFAVMAMLEYHGIDAQWGVLEFLRPSSETLSQYATFEVPALGRGPQVWHHTNHAFAVVHGHIFDGTYDRYAPSIGEYEDSLFARFCYGQDDPCRFASDWCNHPPAADRLCIDNPPGHDPELGFIFYTGDSYH